MKPWRIGAFGLLIGLLAGCGDRHDAGAATRQTGFPGQVTAGGGTSGEVMARAGSGNTGVYIGGTPGIPQGSGGNTGGAATGGTVQQPPSSPGGEIPAGGGK